MTSNLPLLFCAALMVAAVLSSLCIWSRRRVAFKVSGIVVTALYLPLAYASLADLLSRPKPLDLERSHAQIAEAVVISSVLREGEAIFVWLQIPDVTEPRAYALPWDEQRARELHGAEREAEAGNTHVRVRNPFAESAEEGKPVFYAAAQPAPPPKAAAPIAAALVFESTGR